MCVTDTKKVANIVPKAPALPEKAPEPVAIASDADTKKRRGRDALRIDLAAGAPASGVNI